MNLMALETRYLFDGSIAITVDPIADLATDSPAAVVADKSTPTSLDRDRDRVMSSFGRPTTDSLIPPTSINTPTELLVIDASVSDWQSLAQFATGHVDVLVLDASKDGVQQIAAALTTHASNGQRYSALHLLSHGASGVIKLGNRAIDANGVLESQAEFAQIGQGLIDHGDVLLYGCNIGSEQAGANFLRVLAQATSKDVAASTDTTGASALGGNWVLESTTGEIEANQHLLDDVGYQYLLDNRAPIANNDARSLNDVQTIFDGQALRGNVLGDAADSDPDNDYFNVAGIQKGIVAGPVTNGTASPISGDWGTITIADDGSYSYVPNAAARALNSGTVYDVFTYSICDSSHAFGTATITITICGTPDPIIINQPPVPVNDVRTLCESEVINNGQAVRGNALGDKLDTDPDGDAFIVSGAVLGNIASGSAVSGGVGSAILGSYGTLIIQADGSYIYTPNSASLALYQGQSGTDIFTYTICDSGNLTGNATISITVCGEGARPNQPPKANPDSRVICENDPPVKGQAIVGTSLGDNADTDPEGDTLTVVGIRSGLSLASLVEPRGGVGQVIVGRWGSLTIQADGSYVYALSAAAQTLSQGELAADNFTYTISDPAGATSVTALNFEICGLNSAPVARDDVRSTSPNTPITNGASVVGNARGDTNDSDPDRNDKLTVVAVRPGTESPDCLPSAVGSITAPPAEQANVSKPIQGTYGTLTLNPDGSYIYVPNAIARALTISQQVQDVFTYVVTDGNGGSDCAQITIRMVGELVAKDPVSPVVVPPVTPPVVTLPVVTAPTTPPSAVTTPITAVLAPLIFTPSVKQPIASSRVITAPLLAPLSANRTPLALGSAIIPEPIGALPTNPFGDLPRVVKGFVEEAKPAQDECVPVIKATTVRSSDKTKAYAAKPKIKPSLLGDLTIEKNRNFSEQIKVAKKRFSPPANAKPRLTEKEC